MTDARCAAERSEDDVARLRFTGRADEYFRIWIVNISLSIVTLGVYSAWAKVRRTRYFYGNTLLNDAAFEYLADPIAILKGRAIVFGAWVAFEVFRGIAGSFAPAGPAEVPDHPVSYLVLALASLAFGIFLYFFALPELVLRASRFKARNSAHRNVRFRFGAGFPPTKSSRPFRGPAYKGVKRFMWLPLLFVPLSLGLLYPYYACRKRQFFLGHTAYGTTPFSFDATPGAFYRVYSKAMLLFLVFLVGSVATLGIGLLPLYIVFAAYRDAAVARLTWAHTSLGNLRFECNWRMWELFALYLVNSLAIIATVGLMIPWAAIRTARYQIQGISLRAASEIGTFVAVAQEEVTATGEEAVDFLGFDFGL